MSEHIIPNEPPWIVEIDGVSYATPEAVVLLLKAVSEERDALEEDIIILRALLRNEHGYSGALIDRILGAEEEE